ncbi:histidine kinase [Alsobacter sp. SYSU M60028]|uniref:Histidine kinase n=1 Tax=Alsobacter ponti TaxID=2962936 RepID=A0ABT1LHD8_9HYPH|nr:histidine kinase [Alsobacter ponti]MCP8940921.1 histidine kinase [Alsobacter ponti]
MAEYYPLISRAVANLGDSTPDQRKALYARATHALVAQLRSSEPPIPEAEIEQEQLSLEDAIRRVETEIAGGVGRDLLERDEAPPQAAAPPEPQTSLRAWQETRAAAPEQAPAPEPADAGAAYRDEFTYQPERFDEPPAPPTGERLRPPAPRVEAQDRRWVRAAVIAGAVAVVVGLTAAAAIMLKRPASDFAPQPQAARPTETEGKAQERLGGEPPPAVTAQAPAPAGQPSPSPAPAAPAPSAPAAGQPPAAPAQGPAIPAAQRAVLVEQPPEGTQELKPVGGRAIWRLDNVVGGPGEPLDAGIRADIDIPEAGLKVAVLIRKNRDGALPASHTVEMTFMPPSGLPNGPVKDVAVPEMRQDEGVRGTPLGGIAVPVKENLFLIGLSNLPQDVQRNLELIRNRNWWVIAFRYANGRRAILLFEKGQAGDRTIADALQAWQQ